ncbi:MAG: Hsp20/alpha crystallin family protein [Clostridia bacterium]|nr:Hsp20/alpha crystallin family protein [Clostridia bacterium]
MMYPMNRMNRPCHRMPEDAILRMMMAPAMPPRPMGMRVDVQETPDAYILEAELPGVKLADITLTAEDDVLTIAAELNRRPREGMRMHERRTGRVERRFSLEGVRQEEITAACADGILTVTLPKVKPEGAKALRHIPISAPEAAPALPEGESANTDVTE